MVWYNNYHNVLPPRTRRFCKLIYSLSYIFFLMNPFFEVILLWYFDKNSSSFCQNCWYPMRYKHSKVSRSLNVCPIGQTTGSRILVMYRRRVLFASTLNIQAQALSWNSPLSALAWQGHRSPVWYVLPSPGSGVFWAEMWNHPRAC